MKFLLFLLVPLSLKAQQLVDCRLANAQACHNCQTRVLADCSETNNSGAFEKNLKPVQIVLKIANHKNGSERILVVKNPKSPLGDLLSTKKLAELAAKSGHKLKKFETLELYKIQMPMTAKFFKSTVGTELASLGNPTSAARNIASDTNSIAKIGGIGRALTASQLNNGKKESK